MRLAAYARISQDNDASTSIEKQRERIQHEIERRDLTGEPCEWFIDSGISGSKVGIKRPARDDLEKRLSEFDILFVNTLDRLARSTADFVRLADAAQRVGCRIVVVSQPIDFTTPHGRAMAEMISTFAALEAAMIAQRIRQTNEHLVRIGKRTGGQTPYGLYNAPAPDGKGFVLRPDPETAPVVREAALRVIEGESLRSIARDFTERDIPRPQGGDRWDDTSLGRLLRRHALAGMRLFRGALVRDPETGLPAVDEDAAILTRDEWSALQAAFAERANPEKRWTRSPALLSGFLFCPDGEPLYINRSRAGHTGERYVCQCAKAVSVRATDVETHVVRETLARSGHLERMKVEIREGRDWQALADIQAEIDLVSEHLRTARGSDRAALFDTLTRLQDSEDRLLTERAAPEPVLIPTGEKIETAWTTADLSERREILQGQIFAIHIDRARRRGRFDSDRVDITWTEGSVLSDYGAGESRGPRK